MTPKEVIMKYVEAFNRADIDMLTELYADDAVNHQVVTDPVTGNTAIGRMLREEFAKTPMVCIVENILVQDEWVTLEWKEPLGFRGCEVFQVIDSKIKLQRGYYDILSFRKEHPEPSDLIGDV